MIEFLISDKFGAMRKDGKCYAFLLILKLLCVYPQLFRQGP